MALLQKDPHVEEDGTYLIRSLYFDDYADTCLMEKINGTDPRSKFRIRYYNQDTDRIVLEKKSKIRGMCQKESCPLTLAECESLMQGEIPELTPDMSADKRRLLLELKMRCLLPKVIVTYERAPYIYSGGNVRVTFDRKLTSSEEIDQFLTGAYRQRPVMPLGQSILEVKWDEIIPRHIKELLCIQTLTWTSFSKYLMCRRFYI